MDLSERYPPKALAASLDCVHGIPEHILLPTTNLHRRAALRQSALENISLENNPPTTLSRRIRTTGRLEYAGFPEPLSREHRAALKKKAENMPPPRAYVLEIRALRTENTVVSIVENSKISAVDWDVGMPECHLDGVEMLWDTGATATIITKDILNQDFQAHLSDSIHMPYTNSSSTRVQLSFTVEFTNTLFTMNVIAWVVDKEAIPNFRSGILLGQRDCIDAIQCRSIPRSILEARGESVDEKF